MLDFPVVPFTFVFMGEEEKEDRARLGVGYFWRADLWLTVGAAGRADGTDFASVVRGLNWSTKKPLGFLAFFFSHVSPYFFKSIYIYHRHAAPLVPGSRTSGGQECSLTNYSFVDRPLIFSILLLHLFPYLLSIQLLVANTS